MGYRRPQYYHCNEGRIAVVVTAISVFANIYSDVCSCSACVTCPFVTSFFIFAVRALNTMPTCVVCLRYSVRSGGPTECHHSRITVIVCTTCHCDDCNDDCNNCCQLARPAADRVICANLYQLSKHTHSTLLHTQPETQHSQQVTPVTVSTLEGLVSLSEITYDNHICY